MKTSLFKGAKVASMSLALFYMGLAAAQQSPTFTSEQLERLRIREVPGKEGLYIMPGFDGGMSGGNVAILITDEGVVVVDNKYSYSYENIIKQIASVTSLPIRYVLNTHHHFDHAGSNASFMPSAQVIGHENVRINMLRNVGPSASSDGAPRITFSDKTSIHLGNAEVQAHHLGCGHTNGDSAIFFPDLRTIHTGDLFIWGDRMDGTTMAPFIDYENGGCAREWVATLDHVLALDFDTVIPGHGPLLRKVEVRIFRDKFEQLVSRIDGLIDDGVTRENIVAELDISDLNWPLAADRIQDIFDELR